MVATSYPPVRYAVVGLGWFGQAAVLPAFENAENSRLAALVTGDLEKLKKLQEQYGVPAYHYDDYDTLLKSGDIDAVYIVLPNSMHHDFTLRAARHGIHVLCEKPLAATAAEAREMIDVCREHHVRLMTAYRLHFQSGNLAVINALQSGEIGDVRLMHATHTNNVREGNTRLDADLAGGPLRDIGIYCINAARYLFQCEPLEVMALSASSNDPRFSEVAEMVTALLRFPGNRLASFSCGFGEATVSSYQVIGTTGDIRLEMGFTFSGAMKMVRTRNGKSKTTKFAESDQIAPEIVYFSRCIRQELEPEPSGWEGLVDLEIIEAIEESIHSGERVQLHLAPRSQQPDPAQEIERPSVEEPPLINAESPKL